MIEALAAALITLPSLLGPPRGHLVWLDCQVQVEERKAERGAAPVVVGHHLSTPVIAIDSVHRGFFVYDEARRTLTPRPVIFLSSESMIAEQSLETPAAGGGSERSVWTFEVDRRTLAVRTASQVNGRAADSGPLPALTADGVGQCVKSRPKPLSGEQF